MVEMFISILVMDSRHHTHPAFPLSCSPEWPYLTSTIRSLWYKQRCCNQTSEIGILLPCSDTGIHLRFRDGLIRHQECVEWCHAVISGICSRNALVEHQEYAIASHQSDTGCMKYGEFEGTKLEFDTRTMQKCLDQWSQMYSKAVLADNGNMQHASKEQDFSNKQPTYNNVISMKWQLCTRFYFGVTPKTPDSGHSWTFRTEFLIDF